MSTVSESGDIFNREMHTNATSDGEASTSDSQQRTSTQYSFTPSPENSKTSTKPDTTKKEEEDNDDKRDDSMFVCNICLDIAKDAVVSMCGHLYCWPCLNCWLETKPNRQLCPVCKAAISKEKVIPLYGRNSEKQQDPRSKIPPRPQGQRTEPDNNNQGFQGFQSFGDGGFHLSFGIGAFPFGFFASSFNFNDIRPRNGQQQQPGSPQYEEDQFLSKVFLWVAMIFFCWLILA
jgi:E3 ubiquitin-protein ligase RNF5